MDDVLWLCVAIGFVALAILYRELFMDFTSLNTQVDATLQAMADAVSQLQAHITALTTTPEKDTAAIAAIIARMKPATDQLAAAVAAAKQALSH